MKAPAFIFTICLLCLSYLSHAQTSPDYNKGFRQTRVPVVSKGYYSIGNHAEKLAIGSNTKSNPGLKVSRNGHYPSIQKGYYSIGNHREKLGKQVSIETTDELSPGVRPVIKKGYYSIGDHAEKLAQ